MDFTRKDLEKLNKEQLIRVGEYYKLKVYISWKKDKIIDTIMDHVNPEEMEGELPLASVRINRIRESNRS